MGDRALTIFTNGKDQVSPVIYRHWGGDDQGDALRELAKLMRGRDGDVEYACARFVGICHERTSGNLSLGMWNFPGPCERTREKPWDGTVEDALRFAKDKGFSHGDAGVFWVNVETWEARAFNGYGFGGRKTLSLRDGTASEQPTGS